MISRFGILTGANAISEELSAFSKTLNDFLPKLKEFGIKIIIAILIYIIGKKLIKWVLKVLKKFFVRSNADESVSHFLLALTKVVLNVLLIVIVVTKLGVPESSFVALVGSAGLAIGLALQGSLSNLAGGVLILMMKPFKIGDYIIASGNEGTVTGIDIFYTRMLTVDNKLVVIPNGTLSNSSITNVTNEPIRRLDLKVSVDYSENIGKVKEILTQIGKSHEMILKDQEITVFVNNFDPSSIDIGMRVWVSKENYWTLKWDLLEIIKNEFDKNDIVIPFDQLDVNLSNKS